MYFRFCTTMQMAPVGGSQMSDYQIERRLAQTAQSEVLLVRKRATEEYCVLKVRQTTTLQGVAMVGMHRFTRGIEGVHHERDEKRAVAALQIQCIIQWCAEGKANH